MWTERARQVRVLGVVKLEMQSATGLDNTALQVPKLVGAVGWSLLGGLWGRKTK